MLPATPNPTFLQTPRFSFTAGPRFASHWSQSPGSLQEPLLRPTLWSTPWQPSPFLPLQEAAGSFLLAGGLGTKDSSDGLVKDGLQAALRER